MRYKTNNSAYGSAVGSCAMAFLPTGGLYITGGLFLNLLKKALLVNDNNDTNETSGADFAVAGTQRRNDSATLASSMPPNTLSSILLSAFLEAYRSKGVASFLLNDIPLYVVLSKDTGLRGAAIRAERVRIEYVSISCRVMNCSG